MAELPGLHVHRDLLIGIVAALLVHSGLVWWAAQLPARPHVAMVPKDPVVRTVRETVQLPRPPAETPKPEAPKPEAVKPAETPAPQPKQVAQKAPTQKAPAQKAPAQKSRTPQAKAETPPDQPPAKAEPAPLQLSKTYGSEGPGVAVHAGKDESLGDSAVDPTESNTRRRDDGPARGGRPEGGEGDREGDARPEHHVEIVHAVPKTRCKVDWPPGADPGNRVVEVLLSLEVGLDGRVGTSKLLKSAGEPFDSAAVAAVRNCAFSPGSRDGKAFVDRVPFAVEFKPNGR